MITVKQAAKLTGLSTITIWRAVSIAKGNRHSYGRKRMPGLRTERTGVSRLPSMIRMGELRRWLRARERYDHYGRLLKKGRATAEKDHPRR